MGKIINLLKERFTVRKFQPRPVTEKVLHEILESGRLSPSGGNQQPWRFGVITDPGMIKKIASLAYHQAWLAQAPLLIVLCTVFVDDEKGGRDIQVQRYPHLSCEITSMDRDLYWALNQDEHQAKITGTHMILAAREYGVGACWVSRFDVRALASFLNLPRGILPAEILAFGYPESLHTPAQKKSLDELVFYIEEDRQK